ncbi:UDP-N-acetylglucosamine--N-acetylmuramyl-(pentapeptide) pyrophosphoryl-undecaprenol N-acetylglucosamine transferase, partial [Francisella tularensis subsp. holarctica]|nr:UDP-N-acetylglucosamine--N-acetylmuramyl-(pentapeptide) pyrophosphoryl-undecaprenol N-acetylglucosamine transferase [Francisella tularensis subsp. holarctica]
ATTICLSFEIENLHKQFSSKQFAKTKIVGNTVRKDIVALNDKARIYTDSSTLKLLVLGGSQGAKAINEIIAKLIKKSNEQGIV